MAEKIGLIAELDLSAFNRNVTTYIRKIEEMAEATKSAAGSLSSIGSSSAISGITKVSEAIAKVGSAAKTASSAISSAADDGFKEWERAADKAFAFTIKEVQATTREMEKEAQKEADATKRAVDAAIKEAIRRADTILNEESKLFKNLQKEREKAAAEELKLAKKTADEVLRIEAEKQAAIASAIGGTQGFVGDPMGSISGAIQGVLGMVGGLVGGVPGAIIGTLVGMIPKLAIDIASTLLGAIGSAISTVMGTIATLVGKGLEVVVGLFSTILGTIVGVVSSIFGTIASTIQSVLGAAFSTLTSILQGLAQTIFDIFVSIGQTIVSAIGSLIQGVLSAFASLGSSVLGVLSSIFESVTGTIGNLIGGAADLLGGLVGSAVSALGGMVGSVVGVFTDMAGRVLGVVQGMVSDVLAAYTDMGGQMLTIVTGAVAAVVAALIAAGNPLKDWIVEGVAKSAEFEQGMADIASVLRETRQEVEPLAQLITKLGLDPNLVVSAEEASTVVEQLSRNGLTMTQVLEGGAEAAILLANATGGDFAKAADVATMAMQMFGLQASEVNRIADVSQGVVNNSRIELDDWALALGNGGAAAGAFNVTLEDFATGIAGTVNLYHSARQAGTGLTNFLQRLVPLTAPAADEMRKLGLFSGQTGKEFDKLSANISGTQEKIMALDPTSKNYQANLETLTTKLQQQRSELNLGSNAFFTQEGNLRSLAEVSEILRNATASLSDEEQIEALRVIFGNDARNTAIGIANLGAEAFNNLRNEIVITGSAEEAAATRTATLAARWENLGDIWSTIQRQSGAKFNDTLLMLVKHLTELTGPIGNKVTIFFDRLAQLFDSLVAKALPWVDKMLPVLINNFEALANWLMETVFQGGRADYWLLQMTPDVRDFVTKVVSAVDAVKKFVAKVIEIGKAVKEALQPTIDFISEHIKLTDVLIAIGGAIALNVLPGLIKLGSILLLSSKLVAEFREAWESNWLGIRSFFEELWPKIQGPITDFINDVLIGDWTAAWNSALEVVAIVTRNLIEHMHLLNEPITLFIADVLQGKWWDAWQGAKEIAGTTFAWIIEQLHALDLPFATFITDILEGRWGLAWTKAANVVTTVFDTIKAVLKDFDTDWSIFLLDILEGRWGQAWIKLRIAAIAVLEFIRGYVPEWGGLFIESLQAILAGDWVVAWDKAKEAAKASLEALKDLTPEWFDPFLESVKLLIDGKWKEAWEVAAKATNDILETLKDPDGAGGWRNELIQAVEDMVSGKWVEAWGHVKTAANDVLKIWGNATEPGTWQHELVLAAEALVNAEGWALAFAHIRQAAVDVLKIWGSWTEAGTWQNELILAAEAIVNGDGWIAAWKHIQAAAVDILKIWGSWTETGTWQNELILAAEAIVAGDGWIAAWQHIRQAAIDILKIWSDATTPGSWQHELVLAAEAIVTNADWLAAWGHVRKAAVDILGKWLPEDNGADLSWQGRLKASVRALAIEGDFLKAWQELRNSANVILGSWKAHTDPTSWQYSLISSAQLFMDGDSAGGWKFFWKGMGQMAVDLLAAAFIGIGKAIGKVITDHTPEIAGAISGAIIAMFATMIVPLGPIWKIGEMIWGAILGGFLGNMLSNPLPAPTLPQLPSLPTPPTDPKGEDVLPPSNQASITPYGAGQLVLTPGLSYAAAGMNYSPGGLTMVGEKGPELVNLPVGAQVYTAARSADMITKLLSAAGQNASRVTHVLRNFSNEMGANILPGRIGMTPGGGPINNYSYQTINAPIQVGPIYVSDRMDLAEFEYRVEQVVTRVTRMR